MQRILLTGGAGFIGSATVRIFLETGHAFIVNIDKLTYAGNLDSLAGVNGFLNYAFVHQDICDGAALRRVFDQYRPDAVVHLAAESHVDRSIDAPNEFLVTNVLGTAELLNVALDYWRNLLPDARERFRFLHVSTDEVRQNYRKLQDSHLA
jgi:dTDP-glucose 4,6-dehydratase